MMLLKLFVSVFLVAVAAGIECGELQRLKVKYQWATSFGYTATRTEFNKQLWKNVFKEYPELVEKYFTRVRGDNIYSPEFKSHAARLIGAFDMCVSSLDEPDVFDAEVAHLKSQHDGLEIDAQLYKAFLKHIMELVAEDIGDCFDWDAWDACTTLVADGMA